MSVPGNAAHGKRLKYQIFVDAKSGKWSELYHYFTDESGVIRFDVTREAAEHGLIVRQQLRPSVTVY